jgi:hypothetical protein
MYVYPNELEYKLRYKICIFTAKSHGDMLYNTMQGIRRYARNNHEKCDIWKLWGLVRNIERTAESAPLLGQVVRTRADQTGPEQQRQRQNQADRDGERDRDSDKGGQ